MPRHAAIPLRVLVVISTIVVTLVLLLASRVQATPDGIGTEPYQVRSGDNLWDIAADYADAAGDVRDAIDVIMRLNGLSSNTIRPGQILEIPVLAH